MSELVQVAIAVAWPFSLLVIYTLGYCVGWNAAFVPKRGTERRDA